MKTKKLYQSIILLLFVSVMISCKEDTKKNTLNTETPTSETVQNAEGFISKMVKSDKKKYYDSNENEVYEVKYKEDGFKLRTPSSTLLW